MGRQVVVCAPIDHAHYSNGILALVRMAQVVAQTGRPAALCATHCWPNENRLVHPTDPQAEGVRARAAQLGVPLLAPLGPEQLDPDATVIYPETMSGNVLGAARVVRWLGNKPGRLKSDGLGESAGDFIVSHSRVFGASGPVLFFGEQHPAFHDAGTRPAADRMLDLTYIGKGFLYGLGGAVPGTMEVARNWPPTKEQLAALLRSCRFFYTADHWSNINTEALLCGAIPVFLPGGPWSDAEIDSCETGPLPRLRQGFAHVDFSAFEEERRAYVGRVRALAGQWPHSVLRVLDDADRHFADAAVEIKEVPRTEPPPPPPVALHKGLVSVTVTSSKAGIIADALRSVVEHVDVCLLVDLGIKDDTVEVARAVCGEKLVVVPMASDWDGFDMSHVRNFGLDEAAKLGDVAIVVDTDERLQWNGQTMQFLDDPARDVWNTDHEDRSYCKARFFRLPRKRAYIGRAHEVYPNAEGDLPLPLARFTELPKTPEQHLARFEMIVRAMQADIADDPKNPRPRYYLGDALIGLRRLDEAIAAFESCVALRGWNQESAFACFRIATLHVERKEFQKAIDAAALGIGLHPGIPELPFVAAVASFRLGQPGAAWCWAVLSMAHGRWKGTGERIARVGFCYPPGQWEGPYEIAWRALEVLGDAKGAELMHSEYEAALAARTGPPKLKECA